MKKTKLLLFIASILLLSSCVSKSPIDKVLEVNQDGRVGFEWLWSQIENPFGDGDIVYTGIDNHVVFIVIDDQVFSISESAYRISNEDEKLTEYYEGINIEDLMPYLGQPPAPSLEGIFGIDIPEDAISLEEQREYGVSGNKEIYSVIELEADSLEDFLATIDWTPLQDSIGMIGIKSTFKYGEIDRIYEMPEFIDGYFMLEDFDYESSKPLFARQSFDFSLMILDLPENRLYLFRLKN